jgi:hypothetical protein
MTRRAIRPVAILLVAALAACSPSASASPSPSHSAGESEHGHSAEPSESATADACDPGVICDGPLGAGDYVSETTGARVEFTLDDHDWSGLADTEGDGFGLFLVDVQGAAISVVAYSGEIFTDACDGEATSMIGATPADFVAFLAARTGVTASEPVEVEVGGRPGLQVDLTADGTVCGDRPIIWLWTLPVHGDFHFIDQEQARVIAVDGGSATVILVAEAFDDVDWDHFLEHFTEVVDTMTITPL